MQKGLGSSIVGAACLCTGAAMAEGWSVTDFDSVADRATCMSYAETTLNIYDQRFAPVGFIGRSDWTVGGYDLRGDVVDALFVCTDEVGLVAPLLVVHNTDDDSDARQVITDRLSDIWDELVANGGIASTQGGATK